MLCYIITTVNLTVTIEVIMASTPFQQHDHSHCISSALQQAKQLCQERNVRLTPVRELVLELVWQSHQPLGAYELLPMLGAKGFSSAPPTVYRALEFLQEQGLIHRLASINAYTGCCNPGTPHEGHFLLCLSCHQVLELDTHALQKSLQSSASVHGFTIAQQTIEVTGYCARCKEPQSNPLQQA